jgi:LysM repeat protein
MRTWVESACVVLAWSILSIILVAAGLNGSAHPAQANTRTAGSTTEVMLTSAVSVAASPVTATSHTMKYAVRSGDTLSGIAARFAVRGGWLALYAANRRAIGTDPDVIHAGTVLTFPHPPAPAPPTPGRAHRRSRRPAPPPSPPAGPRHHPLPATHGAPAAAGMPQWLKTMLVAVGLLILAAFLAEPLLVVRRRRQQAAVRALPARTGISMRGKAVSEPGKPVPEPAEGMPGPRTAVSGSGAAFSGPGKAGTGHGPGYRRPGTERAHIVLADYDRLVVTRNMRDDTVYVLRPPGEDPKTILRVARLVLPEGSYGELAKQLGMPAIGPVE